MPENIIENKTNLKNILDYALLIAKKMLMYGAEIQRAQQTVHYICEAYGASVVDVFAIPSMLMATVEADDMYYTTKIKVINSNANNFLMLEKLNDLSRYLCENKPSFEEIEKLINELDQYKKPRIPILTLFGNTIGGAALCMYFGGTWRDFLACFLAALIVSSIIYFRKKVYNQFINTFMLALVGGLLSVLVCKIGIGENVNYVMIGCIMILIPGVALSISFKDIFTGDLLSGVIRFITSVVIALMIALGFSVSLFLLKTEFYSSGNPLWIQILSSSAGGVGFSLVYNSNYKHLPSIFIGGAIGIIVYLLMGKYVTSNEFFKSITGSAAVSFYAAIMARLYKAPSTCFLMPSLIPLAPGCFLYKTMYYLTSKNYSLMRENLANTAYVALGIGLGIIIIVVLENYIGTFIKEFKKRRKNV